MKKLKFSTLVLAVTMTVQLSLAGGLAFAADGTHKKQIETNAASPELAAKTEMVQKQKEQRITPEKRKAAAEALKEERLKVYNAKQAVKKSPPAAIDNK